MTFVTPHILSTLVMIAAASIGPASALAGEGQAGDEACAGAEVVEWLDKLEQRGREIESFQARAVYETFNPLLGDRQMRIGDLDYLAADAEADRPAMFAIRFTQRLVNNALRPRNEDLIFDGRWLVERHEERRQFIKRQVVAPGERFDPLAIDGPFPLPLGQERDRVLASFEAQLIESEDWSEQVPHELDEPPVRLRLTPRADAGGEGGRRPFERADLWFDRQTLLPLKVHTIDRSERETTVVLTRGRVNELSADDAGERFDTTEPPPGSGWDVEITRH